MHVAPVNELKNGHPAQGLSPRLTQAAHEFEAQMLSELLKPLTSEELLPGRTGDSDSEESPGGALGEFASECLGRALSVRGGFGIADRILKSLAEKSASPGEASGLGTWPENQEVKSHKSLK